MEQRFLTLIETSIRENWDRDALTDYKGDSLKYKDVARKIEHLHIIFNAAGIAKGDKIALCGKNSSNWGVIFLATLTYGAVSVPILSDFKPSNTHNIVNHSDSKLLFAGANVWENLDERAMPQLKAVLAIEDFSVLNTRNSGLVSTVANVGKTFGKKYKNGFMPKHVSYGQEDPEDLAYISYTSGTTSFSKGVMIPYRSLTSNIIFAHDNMKLKAGDGHVCMLPMAHAFGLLFSFLFEFTKGCHTYFLTRTPSPKIIFQAYQEVKPTLIITVPLIVEKIIKKSVLPKLDTTSMRLMLKVPFTRNQVYKKHTQKTLQPIRWQFHGAGYRWRSNERGSGTHAEIDQFPVFHRLRNDGMRSADMLQQLANIQRTIVRQTCGSNGSEDRFGRPRKYCRRSAG